MVPGRGREQSVPARSQLLGAIGIGTGLQQGPYDAELARSGGIHQRASPAAVELLGKIGLFAQQLLDSRLVTERAGDRQVVARTLAQQMPHHLLDSGDVEPLVAQCAIAVVAVAGQVSGGLAVGADSIEIDALFGQQIDELELARQHRPVNGAVAIAVGGVQQVRPVGEHSACPVEIARLRRLHDVIEIGIVAIAVAQCSDQELMRLQVAALLRPAQQLPPAVVHEACLSGLGPTLEQQPYESRLAGFDREVNGMLVPELGVDQLCITVEQVARQVEIAIATGLEQRPRIVAVHQVDAVLIALGAHRFGLGTLRSTLAREAHSRDLIPRPDPELRWSNDVTQSRANETIDCTTGGDAEISEVTDELRAPNARSAQALANTGVQRHRRLDAGTDDRRQHSDLHRRRRHPARAPSLRRS